MTENAVALETSSERAPRRSVALCALVPVGVIERIPQKVLKHRRRKSAPRNWHTRCNTSGS